MKMHAFELVVSLSCYVAFEEVLRASQILNMCGEEQRPERLEIRPFSRHEAEGRL
jgi:hypothetical protein